MKINLLITGTFCLVFMSCISQTTINFGTDFKENKEYLQTTTSKSTIKRSYSGEGEIVEELRQANVPQHQTKTDSSYQQTSIKIGRKKDKICPITITILKSKNCCDDQYFFAKDKLIGEYSVETGITINSTDLVWSMEAFELEDLKETIGKIYSSSIVKGIEMGVGDTCKTTTFIAYPSMGKILPLAITSNYKLEKIEDGFAYFDLEETYHLNTKVQGMFIKVVGSGKGNAKFDINNRIITSSYHKYTLTEYGRVPDGIKTESVENIEVTYTTKPRY